MQYTQPAARLATWPTKRLKPRSTSPFGSQIAWESCENALTSLGFLCMISMLFGTKPRLFFENSKVSSSLGASPTRRSKTRSSRPPSGAGARRSPRTRRKTSTYPSAFSRVSDGRTSGRLSPTPLSVPIPLVLSAFRRRGLTGRCRRPAKACPVVRGARRDQPGEPRVDQRFGAQEVQSAEYRYAAQDREPEQPALAVLKVREHVAQHGNRNQIGRASCRERVDNTRQGNALKVHERR